MKSLIVLAAMAGVLALAAGCQKTPGNQTGMTNSVPPASTDTNAPSGETYTNAAPMTTNGAAK